MENIINVIGAIAQANTSLRNNKLTRDRINEIYFKKVDIDIGTNVKSKRSKNSINPDHLKRLRLAEKLRIKNQIKLFLFLLIPSLLTTTLILYLLS